MRRFFTGPLFFFSIAACVGQAEPGAQAGAKSSPKATPTAPVSNEGVERPVAPKPTFVVAPPGDAAQVVQSTVASAPDPQRVLVYVGAGWCEPCTRFHKAVEAGTLDDKLAGVVFVEFDADNDRARLAAAGYDGKLIPRFVRPSDDGSASQKRIEGGVKGDRAVENIMGRLTPLLPSGA